MGDVPPFFALNRRLTFGGCTVKAICIVATLNLVLIAASPGFAVVTVTWTPPVVSESVLSGTLKTFSVSFISTQRLQDINVAVVPALTPYVRVTPSHFDQVVRGVKNEVQVFVSLQDGTPPGELNGTIQLRSRLTPSNVFGRPLPVLVVANPPTATSIPSVISLPSPDRIVVATAANPSFAANEIDISVVAGTPDSVVEALASSENATFWGRDSRARIYQLRFAFPDFLTALTLGKL